MWSTSWSIQSSQFICDPWIMDIKYTIKIYNLDNHVLKVLTFSICHKLSHSCEQAARRKQEFSPQGYGSGGKRPNLLCFTKVFLKKKNEKRHTKRNTERLVPKIKKVIQLCGLRECWDRWKTCKQGKKTLWHMMVKF